MDLESLKNTAIDIKETAKEIARPTKRGYYIESKTVKSILEGFFCIFFPPIAIGIHGGPRPQFHYNLGLCCLLTLLGWFPGIAHSTYYCFFSGF